MIHMKGFSRRTKTSHDHRAFERLKVAAFGRHLRTLCLAIVIGALGGYGAVLFRKGIKLLQYLFYQNADDFLTFAANVSAYLKVGLPALGGLIVGLLVTFGAPEAKGHGVPEVMEAVALREGRIRKRVALVKILASGICIGSGGSVGREGPIVQIGSGMGSTVGQLLKVKGTQLKTLIGCGAAAGIAATFNAPIAGTLFALEILLGDFGLASFSPVVLSAVLATTISRHYFGELPSFIVPAYSLQSNWEIFTYPFMGVLCGLVALLFVSCLYWCEDLFEKLPLPVYLKATLGGLLLGVMILYWPYVFGVGYGAVNVALVDQLPLKLLLMLALIKILATSITLGSGGSGGIFAPSLFIGAMTGAFFGTGVHLLFPAVTAGPGAYALVAMGALVAGTTQAPITAILIIFELTNDYHIILPLMASCLISTIITSVLLKGGSIYTIKLLRRGIDIHSGMEQNILRSLKVHDLMEKKIARVNPAATVPEILAALRDQDASYLHVLDDRNELTGILSFRDIRRLGATGDSSQQLTAAEIATPEVSVITPADDLRTALHLMSVKEVSQLPVVSEADSKKVLGILRQKDILTAYDKAVVRKELEE
jgi:CIC family chloride channel protein